MSNEALPPTRPKKIWFGSDFHYERYTDNYRRILRMDDIPSDAPYDYAVIAGDLTHSKHVGGVLKSIQTRMGIPILFTPGNHEFWDGRNRSVTFDDQLCEMREACDKLDNVTFLYNEGFDIPGTNSSLFMSPWFTNLEGYTQEQKYWLMGDEGKFVEHFGLPPQSYIQDCIGDYGRTYMGSNLLTAQDHIRLNKQAVDALGAGLETDVLNKGRTPIICTHFGPSAKSAHGHFPDRDLVASYFNTNYLDKPGYIFPKGTTWIHGHTHWNVDYMIDNVRVVTNQYGYLGESETNNSYDFFKHIEVQ